MDKRRWKLEATGVFSSKSFRIWLKNDNSFPNFEAASFIWNSRVPPKIKILGWLVAHKRLNTSGLLQRRRPKSCFSPSGSATDSWSLCSVKQVEELKALIKVPPIWSTGFMIAVTISQHSFSVIQANTMDRRFLFNTRGILLLLWHFHSHNLGGDVRPNSSSIDIIKVHEKASRLELQATNRNGASNLLLATVVAAEVERHRRRTAIQEGLANNPHGVVTLSGLWLGPQHCLSGLAEVFNAIGQIEFYYSQFPKSVSSIAVALFSLGFGMGSLIGSLLVTIVDNVTKKVF